MEDYRDVLDHIDGTWGELTFQQPEDRLMHIGLPNPFVSPSANRFAHDQFYWDSYFTVVGLIAAGRLDLAKGMVDNLLYLHERFGLIPARNRFFNVGMSNPPLLTAMAREVYKHMHDKAWLGRVTRVAREHLDNYWRNTDNPQVEIHEVYEGLSRYCDHFITHDGAEHESGWDMTSRFHHRCLDFVPVDLNCILYKYERDLAFFYEELGVEDEAEQMLENAAQRAHTIRALMWDDTRGMYVDFDYVVQERSEMLTLAGYFAMWSGVATEQQAERMRAILPHFEREGGLAATEPVDAERKLQWDYPNGWAPLHWIVFSGLRKYGFDEDAERIGMKWLNLCAEVYRQTGRLWERYDVEAQTKGETTRYEIEPGFGWTNGVFVRIFEDLHGNDE